MTRDVDEEGVFNSSIMLSFLSKILFLKKSTSPTYSHTKVRAGIFYNALTMKPYILSYSIRHGG